MNKKIIMIVILAITIGMILNSSNYQSNIIAQDEYTVDETIEMDDKKYSPSGTGTLTLRPTGVGAESWTEVGAATAWECIDEEIANDADYIIGVSSAAFRLTYPDPTGYTDEYNAISKVTFYARLKGASSSSDFQWLYYMSPTFNYIGSGFSLTTSYVLYSIERTTDAAGGAWSWLDINNTQWGGRNYYDDNSICSQYYIVITYTIPNPPESVQAPTLDNADEGDYMFSNFEESDFPWDWTTYKITCYTEDIDGADTIDFVYLELWNDVRDTKYYGVVFEDGVGVSETYDPNGYATIPWFQHSGYAGNTLNITFGIVPDWDFPDATDLDMNVTVIDEDDNIGSTFYETSIDVETRLDITNLVFSDTDQHGGINRGRTVTGDIIYYGTSTEIYEYQDDVIDVWISADKYGNYLLAPQKDGLIRDGFSIGVSTDNEVGIQTFTIIVVEQGTGSGGTSLLHSDDTIEVICDNILFEWTNNGTWTVKGYDAINATLLNVTYEYTGLMVGSGNYTLTNPSGVYWYADYTTKEFAVATLTESVYGIETYTDSGSFTAVWDDVDITTVSYYWTQYSETAVWLIWGNPTTYTWRYNSSQLANGIIIQSQMNGTDNSKAAIYGGSISGLAIGPFDQSWWYTNISIYAQYDDIDYLFWTEILTVDIKHTLEIDSFTLIPTADDFWVVFQTNLGNATIIIWDDLFNSGTTQADAIYSGKLYEEGVTNSEGMHYWERDTTVGVHLVSILINSSATSLDEQYKDYSFDYYWLWYNFTYTVAEPDSYECHIVLIDTFGDVIDYLTFEVYNNGTRQYYNLLDVVDGYVYNITVKNRYGDYLYLNTTHAFEAAREFVITIDVYSLKFASYYTDWCYFNITRGGHTYVEAIAPYEIRNFMLYTGTYYWGVNFRDGLGWSASGNINLVNSTAIIITGSGITDLLGMLESVYEYSADINITVYATNDYVLTIYINLENINTTINEQLVYVLLNITNTNSVIGQQTIDILAELQSVNSTLYNQTVDIIIDLDYINSTVLAGFISVAADLLAIDSNLYANFTSITATLSLIDSSLVSNFTEIIASLTAIGSEVTSSFLTLTATLLAMDTNLYTNFTSISASLILLDSNLYSNFTEIIATLSVIGSNITSEFLSLSATLIALDSNLYANFTSISASLILIDSNLYSNFTSVTATLSAIGTNITTNYLNVAATLSLIDSQLLSNFTNIVTQLLSVNSSIASQFITVISYSINMNTTMYLIDDPTHLNPLILGYSLSDEYCDFTVMTTWHNSTLSIYDNNILRIGPTSELLSPIRYPLLSTSGTHNLSVFIDGGLDSFWYNISYTVAEIIAFEIVDWDVSPHFGVENYLELSFETTWENSTIYTYMNGTLQSAVLEQYGGVTSVLWMSSGSGLHQYVFNVTSGTNVITLTWSLFVPDWADTGLVMWWDMWHFDNNITTVSVESNWRNATIYIYFNSSLIASSPYDPYTFNITRDINYGTYNMTIVVDGGTQIVTITNIWFTITEEGVTYDYSSVTGGVSYLIYEGDVEEGDTIIYENPPGVFMSSEVAATLAVTGIAIFFFAYLFVDRLLKKERLKERITKGD